MKDEDMSSSLVESTDVSFIIVFLIKTIIIYIMFPILIVHSQNSKNSKKLSTSSEGKDSTKVYASGAFGIGLGYKL